MTAESVYGGSEETMAKELQALRAATRRALLVAVLAIVVAFVLVMAERQRIAADAAAEKMKADARRIVWLNAPEFGRVEAQNGVMYSVQGGLIGDHTMAWRFRALPQQVPVSAEDLGAKKKRGFFGRLFGR